MEDGEIQSARDDAPLSRSKGSQSEKDNGSNSWVIQVREKFHSGQYTKPSPGVCIYRVPELFRRSKPEAYHPEFVSFGPFHHNKHQGFLAMEDHKLEAVHRTLKRLEGKSIDDILTVIRGSEKDIRDCYEDSAIDYDSETLAWMMTMDACFILEFLRVVYVEKKKEFSRIFINSTVDNTIQCGILNDILKLENQIPLVILISILKLEFEPDGQAVPKLIEFLLRCEVFQCYPFYKKTVEEKWACQYNDACHLLDLCRKMITGFLTHTSGPVSKRMTGDPDSERTDSHSHYYEIPRAELLHNAGIQFQTCDEGNLRFEKRTLRNSTLFLPKILMENTTEATFRNLIIFEVNEKLKEKSNVITNYISFMNKLINTEKDVALLTKEGIIINWLGSDKEVAAVFNNLEKETYIAGIKQFVDVAEQVKAEYNRKTKVWMNQFIEEYCSKPWYTVSLVAAILILVMTAVQTVYSVQKN